MNLLTICYIVSSQALTAFYIDIKKYQQLLQDFCIISSSCFMLSSTEYYICMYIIIIIFIINGQIYIQIHLYTYNV